MTKKPKEGAVVFLPFIVDYSKPIPLGCVRLRPKDGSKWSMSRILTIKEFNEQFAEDQRYQQPKPVGQ